MEAIEETYSVTEEKSLRNSDEEVDDILPVESDKDVFRISLLDQDKDQNEILIYFNDMKNKSVLDFGKDDDYSGQCTIENRCNNLLTRIINTVLVLVQEKTGDGTNLSEVFLHNSTDDGKIPGNLDLEFAYRALNDILVKLKQLKHYFEEFQRSMKRNADHLKYEDIIHNLEEKIHQQNLDLETLSNNLQQESNNCSSKLNNMKNRYEVEITALQKKLECADNEKNSAIIRYAVNEKQSITLRKEKETLEKKIKELQKENSKEMQKCKVLNAEKNNIADVLSNKKTELATVSSNVENLKEELRCKDIKTKWIEEEFRNEIKRYKEANDTLKDKVKVLEAEIYELKQRISVTAVSENLTTVSLFENNGNRSESGSKISNTGNGDCRQQSALIDELSLKIQELETDRLNYEQNLSRLKLQCERQNEKIVELENHLSDLETLRAHLEQNERNLITSYQCETDKLKELNNDLQQEVKSCRDRDAELLSFTEKLTAKNVTLQTECAALGAKKAQLENESSPLEKRKVELEESVRCLNERLEEEISSRNEENERWSRQLADKSAQIDHLMSQLEEKQAEHQSLKNKYTSSIKELSKELQQLRKCHQVDVVYKNGSNSVDCVSLESRTSSCNSLNDGATSPLQQTIRLEPDRQTLIEKIVTLQRDNAKYAEKIEFLEEHVSQMLADIKKKTRILQGYILREQTGALSSDVMDRNKAEMSKYGGIMSMLYSNGNNNVKTDEGAITLDLSLEINRKLQAVLEDTLLKNITLKENMETLGKEIERLSKTKS